jgi:trimethylguanosine synthase
VIQRNFTNKRRYLFSKYDLGIELDEESWYSVTPESVGEYLAEKVASKFPSQKVNVLDAFAGCGGNIIQFGKKCHMVYGCEIDQTKIDYCDSN